MAAGWPTSPTSPGSKYQVSTDGAGLTDFAVWVRNGRELIYVEEDRLTLMAAEVRMSSTFRAGVPRRLFKLPAGWSSVDVARDGRRVIAAVPAGQATVSTISVVMNWTAAIGQP